MPILPNENQSGPKEPRDAGRQQSGSKPTDSALTVSKVAAAPFAVPLPPLPKPTPKAVLSAIARSEGCNAQMQRDIDALHQPGFTFRMPGPPKHSPPPQRPSSSSSSTRPVGDGPLCIDLSCGPNVPVGGSLVWRGWRVHAMNLALSEDMNLAKIGSECGLGSAIACGRALSMQSVVRH